MSPLCTDFGCPDEIENASMNDMSNTPDTPLQRRLASEVKGDILFDAFSRGRYATDASIYQIMPVGAVVPETMDDAIRAVALAREERVTVLPRGGGTSQCGQTVNPPSSSTARSASTASSTSTSPAAPSASSRASSSTTSTASSRSTGSGTRSTSPPPRAPRSAA